MYLPIPNYVLTYLPKFQRIATSAFAGLCASVGLLWLMTQLIATDGSGYKESPPLTITDWVRTVEDKPAPPKEVIQEPPPVEDVPLERPLIAFNDADTGFGVETFGPPAGDDQVIDVRPGLADGNALPLVRVAPNYPRRAAARGIEGYVVVGFSIAPSGAVVNPVVVDAAPPGIFDRAALNAIKKYKYKPRVVDQKAVAVEGILHRIVFNLEGS